MERIGIVLSGGGGKGAYQIGVWKYLIESGLDKYITAVSGTSVGALNAVLFAMKDYKMAEDIWLNIEKTQILSPRTAEDISKLAYHMGKMIAFGMLSVPIGSIVELENLIKESYFFSREGLLKIMNKINLKDVDNSNIFCSATCYNKSKLKKESFVLSRYSLEEKKNILLASSAIPAVFDAVDINGDSYCDGGIPIIGENVPIKSLYDIGIRKFIVVNLGNEKIVGKNKYKNAVIIEIKPQQSLGNLINGTLDFSKESSMKRLSQGYEDAKRMNISRLLNFF